MYRGFINTMALFLTDRQKVQSVTGLSTNFPGEQYKSYFKFNSNFGTFRSVTYTSVVTLMLMTHKIQHYKTAKFSSIMSNTFTVWLLLDILTRSTETHGC